MFILARADSDVQTAQTIIIQELPWIHTIWFIRIRNVLVQNAPHFQQTPLLIYINTKESNMVGVGKPLVAKGLKAPKNVLAQKSCSKCLTLKEQAKRIALKLKKNSK